MKSGRRHSHPHHNHDPIPKVSPSGGIDIINNLSPKSTHHSAPIKPSVTIASINNYTYFENIQNNYKPKKYSAKQGRKRSLRRPLVDMLKGISPPSDDSLGSKVSPSPKTRTSSFGTPGTFPIDVGQRPDWRPLSFSEEFLLEPVDLSSVGLLTSLDSWWEPNLIDVALLEDVTDAQVSP